MFVSVRDQGRRRRSNSYGVSKAAHSSKLSLLSAVTSGSNGSNDSSSTITQESYKKSSASSKRRASQSKRVREKGDRKASPMKVPSNGPSPEKSISRESVDVFAFLVDVDGQETPALVCGSSAQSELANHVGVDSDTEGTVRSQHSDSGISMGDSSICQPHDLSPVESRLPALPEDSDEFAVDRGHVTDTPTSSKRLRWKWPDVPPATHKPHTVGQGIRVPSPNRTHNHTPSSPKEEHFTYSPTLSGYELIAHKLARGELPPVFRSFHKSTFRMLLQLQDEISEMEEELAALDMADTRTRLKTDGSMLPASRRLNWQWTRTDLDVHRLQVLGRLYIKIEQYYQALLSAQRVQRLSSSAVPSDVETFRAWLKENKPLSAPESKFLDHEDDLISLDTGQPTTSAPASTAAHLVPVCVLMSGLLPLLCFKIINGVLNRLILLAVLLAVGMSFSEKLGTLQAQHHQQWLVACFGVSLMAALFL
ncbi:hypothetical protein EDD37DRAFT_307519 [Exophiala viscosa]|uniref:uncharacterized protein n=1 Tax=Exophiala viscosa TaxID=2486360 RepID=UPI0021974843|nr:hypothetical protein EDD37DRAFT_307519 [Exophiala viscosa]